MDKYHILIKGIHLKNGYFVWYLLRTSNKIHHETSRFFKTLYDKAAFLKKGNRTCILMNQPNIFLADRYNRRVPCATMLQPMATNENCGSSLSLEQLINPRSTLSDTIPVKKKPKHWYFPLQNWTRLKQWILEEPHRMEKHVWSMQKLEIMVYNPEQWPDSNWGVKVPPPDTEGKVLYIIGLMRQ